MEVTTTNGLSVFGKRISRRSLLPNEVAQALTLRQGASIGQRQLKPCQLVYRNYWWQLVQGQGLIEELHHFDDGSGPDPEFDFLTASLMGWNAFFEDDAGAPTPFPLWRAHCNVGELPMSRDYFLVVGFLDPANSTGAPGKPWTAWIQIGFEGWKVTC